MPVCDILNHNNDANVRCSGCGGFACNNCIRQCSVCGSAMCFKCMRSCLCLGSVPLCPLHFQAHYAAAHALWVNQVESNSNGPAPWVNGPVSVSNSVPIINGPSTLSESPAPSFKKPAPSNSFLANPVLPCQKRKVSIGVGTWNIHKLSKSTDEQELSTKLAVIATLFQKNPWLNVLGLQEVNSTGIGILRRSNSAFKMLSSGPLLKVEYPDENGKIICRYSEYYPLLVSKSGPSVNLLNIELYWGTGEVTSLPPGKPGEITYKGEGAPDDIKNRPVVVYTVQKAGDDFPVKVGIVHTSPGYGSQFNRVAIFQDQVKLPLMQPKDEEFAVFVGDYYLPHETRVLDTSSLVKSEIEALKTEGNIANAQKDFHRLHDEELGELGRKIKDVDAKLAQGKQASIASVPSAKKIDAEIDDKNWLLLTDFYPEEIEKSEDPNYNLKVPRTRVANRSAEEQQLREEITKLNNKLRRELTKARKEGTFALPPDQFQKLNAERKELVEERDQINALWPTAGINEVRNVAQLTLQQNLTNWQTIVSPISGTNIHGKEYNSRNVRTADYCIASGPWTTKCGGMFKDLPLIQASGSGGCLVYDENGMAIQEWMKVSDHAPAGGYFSNLDHDLTPNQVLCLDQRALHQGQQALKKLRQDEEISRRKAAEYQELQLRLADQERTNREKLQSYADQGQLPIKKRYGVSQRLRTIREREEEHRDEAASATRFLSRPKRDFTAFRELDFDVQEQPRKRMRPEPQFVVPPLPPPDGQNT